MIPLFDNVWYMDQQNSRIILLIASQAFASLQPTLGWLHSLCSTCSRMKTVKLEAIYPLGICYIAMENPQHKWSFLAGKIICKWSMFIHFHPFSIAKLPEAKTGNGKTDGSPGDPTVELDSSATCHVEHHASSTHQPQVLSLVQGCLVKLPQNTEQIVHMHVYIYIYN